MRTTVLLLMVPILFALGACAGPAPVYPRYQPVAEDSHGVASLLCTHCEGTVPQDGYSDYPIDERTYLVTYQGFIPIKAVSWTHLSYEEWIEMVHDYVLYRAAELARSKGVKQFVILHKDDSNQSWRVWIPVRDRYGRYYGGLTEAIGGFHPGARVLIRLIADDGGSILATADQLYKVDTLMGKLMKKNAELARHQGVDFSPNDSTPNEHRFIRWRVPVLLDDTGLEPSLRNRTSLWLDFLLSRMELYGSAREKRKNSLLETEITADSRGVFEIVQWSRSLRSPIDLLRECIKVADREGYPAFKLEDWITHEYRPGRVWDGWNDRDVWFRTKARLVLQHQSEPNSLEPVFVVDEIRKNVAR